MSLQLSAHKPRALQYVAGGLRGDFRLLELDESLLAAVEAGDVVIKGCPDQEAVLCTQDKTYAVKLVETTNTLLLLPPHEEFDEEFAGLPSMPSPGADASAVRDVGLQTQLQKGAAAAEFPPLVASATAASHLELVEAMPRLQQLPELLGRPYGLEDEELDQQQQQLDAAAAAAAGGSGGGSADTMDVDGGSPPPASRPEGCHTTEELLARVQASRSELLAELRRLQALQLGGFWRRVEPSYLGALLEMLVVCAMERGWELAAPIELAAAVEALQPEGYRPALIQHCLQVFSATPQQQQQQDAAAGQAEQATSTTTIPSSSSSYVLDGSKVCLQYARKLLAQRASWPLSEFLAAWRAEVPGGCWVPLEAMLAGEAVILTPEPSEGAAEPRVRHFPAASLPAAPGPRFASLFGLQPRWSREQLDPYLEGLKVPGQTVDMVLLKHARASQRSPTDATLVFVAR